MPRALSGQNLDQQEEGQMAGMEVPGGKNNSNNPFLQEYEMPDHLKY